MSRGMNKNTKVSTVKLVQNIGPKIDWNNYKKKQLVSGILAIKNEDEAQKFLRDILTSKEIEEFSNRFEAAKLLSEDVQYNAIIESTGLSSTTIARISKWLKGSLGGYRLILNRINKHHHINSKLKKGLILS